MGFARKEAAGVLVVVGFAFGPTAVAAERAIGGIVATIDGEAHEWRALGADMSGADYNTSLQDFGPMQIASVMGFPPGRPTMRGTIQLTFTVMSGGMETFEQEVIYAPDGMRSMWVSLDGEDLITIEHFEATAAGGDVSGRLSGRLCLLESLFAEPDPDNCKSIEGTFSSQLPAASS
jgi:hypothetical protein